MKIRKSKNKHLLKLATKFQPWDWSYMIALEKQMIKQILEYHEHANIIVDSPKIARQAKWALKLLNIADGTDNAWCYSGSLILDINGFTVNNPNYKAWLNVYINTRNYKRFVKIPNPNWNHSTLQDHLRQQKAWYIYNKLRFYYLQTWWD